MSSGADQFQPGAPVDVAGYELAARALLPNDRYDYFAGGADDEVTLDRSRAAWSAYELSPHILRDVATVETRTTLLGQPVRSPIAIAPVGYQQLAHGEAERAMAQGAAQSNTLYAISSRSSTPLAEIASAAPGGARWFQIYVMRDREATLDLVREAKATGCTAIVLTADMPVLARRLRDVRSGFTLPASISSAPRNGAPHLQTGSTAQDPSLTYDVIDWLASETGLPVVVKGVLRGDDAKQCITAGAAAVWVSAHGGRQLDGCVAPAVALPAVVDSVGGDAEVYVDGGVRRGVDAVRALCLGAKGVFVGRPPIWGLAVGGAAGVAGVMDHLNAELRLAMALCGAARLEDLTPDLLTYRHS